MLAAPSWTARLRHGLARTRAVLDGGLGALFRGGTVDEALYEELEIGAAAGRLRRRGDARAARRLRARARREGITEPAALKRALQDELRALLAPLERRLDLTRAKPLVIMIAGVNGSGKTTSIGKLAKWLQGQGRSVLLAAGDTFRAAAREQLAAWGERNGVAGDRAGSRAIPAAVIFDAIGRRARARHRRA